ncbi:SGNH/GDSL hydrolase family protein [Pleomorphovibrio marinus]|uniref:SGNH/GDSL hydrolase family protein n=1 Tax=Pleomorphovibrio marinus TaxID=2164132 RepID=UPI0013008198|nr:SGNH/GDSL hydrolase family protein [Pleomorphovibrio marinus]
MHKLLFSAIISLFFLMSNVNTPLPKLFVIGDSISIQYGPYLEQYLDGFYRYDRKRDDGKDSQDLDQPQGANGGDSGMVLEYLQKKREDPTFAPDILLLNCGLHDIKRDPESGEIQVSITQYEENLRSIYALAVEIGTKVVWVRTTPLDEERHNNRSTSFHRFEKDLMQYNEVGDKVGKEFGAEIIDLHRFTENLGSETFVDHVHFDEGTRSLQAAFIAGFLIK